MSPPHSSHLPYDVADSSVQKDATTKTAAPKKRGAPKKDKTKAAEAKEPKEPKKAAAAKKAAAPKPKANTASKRKTPTTVCYPPSVICDYWLFDSGPCYCRDRKSAWQDQVRTYHKRPSQTIRTGEKDRTKKDSCKEVSNAKEEGGWNSCCMIFSFVLFRTRVSYG